MRKLLPLEKARFLAKRGTSLLIKKRKKTRKNRDGKPNLMLIVEAFRVV